MVQILFQAARRPGEFGGPGGLLLGGLILVARPRVWRPVWPVFSVNLVPRSVALLPWFVCGWVQLHVVLLLLFPSALVPLQLSCQVLLLHHLCEEGGVLELVLVLVALRLEDLGAPERRPGGRRSPLFPRRGGSGFIPDFVLVLVLFLLLLLLLSLLGIIT